MIFLHFVAVNWIPWIMHCEENIFATSEHLRWSFHLALFPYQDWGRVHAQCLDNNAILLVLKKQFNLLVSPWENQTLYVFEKHVFDSSGWKPLSDISDPRVFESLWQRPAFAASNYFLIELSSSKAVFGEVHNHHLLCYELRWPISRNGLYYAALHLASIFNTGLDRRVADSNQTWIPGERVTIIRQIQLRNTDLKLDANGPVSSRLKGVIISP